MEEVNWVFNGDFEQRLFEKRFFNIQSSKATQEFEYFIHLIDPDFIIFSNKNYSKEYRDFLLSLTGESLKLSLNRSNIKNWCGDYSQLDLKTKLQDKTKLSQYLDRHGLLEITPNLISAPSELEEGYLYKYPKSLSGAGHYFFPQHEKRLKKILDNNEIIIKEKLYKRFMDFSALINKGEIVSIYKNNIDDYFQYKGTIIEKDFTLGEFECEFHDVVRKILEWTQDYQGIFSIDSFLYLENAKKFLYPACELNIRKTMGYIALNLKDKYFTDSSIFKMSLYRNTFKKISYDKLEACFGKKVVLVSPGDNRFLVFIMGADTRNELAELESELNSTFL